ncbi:MAG TPA: hypothetical protein VHO68_09755, partial [Bacteroidales bacterium]|nr:hypothetical protein [Bacteroidales bacterium]
MKNLFAICLLAFYLVSCNPSGNKKQEGSPAAVENEFKVVNRGNQVFDEYFEGNTMRLDYYHSGTAKEEHFAKNS